MIFFSVIIPSYNHARFIEQRIQSVLDQAYENFDVIIIDDCSSDESNVLINKYAGNNRVTIVYTERNTGSPYGNWQKGLELAKGEWVWIAESDDFADSSFLAECDKMIRRYPGAGICYCDSRILNESEQKTTGTYAERKNKIFNTVKWSYPYYNTGTNEINECLKYDCTINNVSAAVFKKELTTPFPGDLSTYTYYGDWFFFLKICFSAGVCYVPLPLNTYRLHPGSFLNAETSLTTAKREYFNLLKLLYYQKEVTNKEELVTIFAYNYLAFGLLQTRVKKIATIIASYFASDKKLAFKIITKIIFIKLFYQRYKTKYELTENRQNVFNTTA